MVESRWNNAAWCSEELEENTSVRSKKPFLGLCTRTIGCSTPSVHEQSNSALAPLEAFQDPSNKNNADEATSTHEQSGNNGGSSITCESNRTCIASNTSPAGSASSDALLLQKSIQIPDNSDSAKEVINTDVQSEHNGKNSIIATSNRTSTTSDTPFLGASPSAVVP